MLDDRELEKYNRQIIIGNFGIQGQEKLKASKVCVIGLGGLGSGIVYYLASAGIGFLGLIAGAVTGFMEPDYPLAALEASAIMRFKILWSVVCLEIYFFLIVVRAKLGDRIWVKPSTYIPYAALIIIGGGFMVLMGALGGLAVYGESIMQPIFDWAGLPWP